MANYQELLVKAISALPDNNGTARRDVYEKARKALVDQLRAISPPLPAREITQHRLELEDCIRHVEQESTEKILGKLKQLDDEPVAAAPLAPPAPVAPTAVAPPPVPVVAPVVAETAPSVEAPIPAPEPAAAEDSSSIDAIIARADSERMPPAKETVTKNPVSEHVGTGDTKSDIPAEAAPETKVEKTRPASYDGAPPKTDLEKALEQAASSDETSADAPKKPAETQPTFESDAAVGAAMSRVREVEVEVPIAARKIVEPAVTQPAVTPAPTALSAAAVEPSGNDPQQVVDRALEALNREARGEHELDVEPEIGVPAVEMPLEANGADTIAPDETRFKSGIEEEKGGSALTIFLVLAIVLLAAVGGGGYWASREGYIDLNALFAQADPAEMTGAETDNPENDGSSDVAEASGNPATDDGSGPGNTTTNPEDIVPAEQLATLDEPEKIEERLDQSEVPVESTQDAAPAGDDDKVEDRLGTDEPANIDPAVDSAEETAVASSGAQSLLLEANPGGTTGAVPFSGTVGWERGVDELGQPTLIGRANIPARALSVEILIRRNADPTLPASHLVEIQFETSETFVGGSIASFGGILLKNEELVPGRSLIGAPARIFENMFLFALNSTDEDLRTNVALLETNKWMDLALVYATGRQAIITLEKDDAADAMFKEVLAIWAEEVSN